MYYIVKKKKKKENEEKKDNVKEENEKNIIELAVFLFGKLKILQMQRKKIYYWEIYNHQEDIIILPIIRVCFLK